MTETTLDEVWSKAESLFQGVHLDKVRDRYIAQVNRRACICDRCSYECEGSTPVEALSKAIMVLSSRPVHEIQGN